MVTHTRKVIVTPSPRLAGTLSVTSRFRSGRVTNTPPDTFRSRTPTGRGARASASSSNTTRRTRHGFRRGTPHERQPLYPRVQLLWKVHAGAADRRPPRYAARL